MRAIGPAIGNGAAHHERDAEAETAVGQRWRVMKPRTEGVTDGRLGKRGELSN